MSKNLAHLLGVSEIEITKVIQKLESLSGYRSEDVRLLADIRSKSKSKILQLGLDPADTTGRELHRALIHKLETDNKRLSKALGTKYDQDGYSRTLIELANHTGAGGEVMALKKAVAKDLLKSDPPKGLMKYLGCRSVESMIKTHDISELYAALPFVESSRWLSKFWTAHQKLTSNDFESRKVEFIVMDSKHWGGLSHQTGLVTCQLQLGTAAVWPAPTRLALKMGFSTVILLYEAVKIMRLYSSAIKLEQFKPNFGRNLIGLMESTLHSPVVVEGMPVSWSSLHNHYANLPGSSHPSQLEPLQPEDMHLNDSVKKLSNINPSFAWWVDTDHIATLDGEVVSFNLADIMLNRFSGGRYESRSNENLVSSLWDEIISRYLKHQGVENHMLNQLDNGRLASETINIENNKYQPRGFSMADFV